MALFVGFSEIIGRTAILAVRDVLGDGASYTSLTSIMSFLVALGVIGEYLGRLYEESKQRPLYLVSAWHPAPGPGALPDI